MKNVLKSFVFLFTLFIFISCSQGNDIDESLEKKYFYNIDDIYIKTLSKNTNKTQSISDITYVIPTIYNNESYNFEITTLKDDGSVFNCNF